MTKKQLAKKAARKKTAVKKSTAATVALTDRLESFNNELGENPRIQKAMNDLIQVFQDEFRAKFTKEELTSKEAEKWLEGKFSEMSEESGTDVNLYDVLLGYI